MRKRHGSRNNLYAKFEDFYAALSGHTGLHYAVTGKWYVALKTESDTSCGTAAVRADTARYISPEMEFECLTVFFIAVLLPNVRLN
jgi:hypothetical protein